DHAAQSFGLLSPPPQTLLKIVNGHRSARNGRMGRRWSVAGRRTTENDALEAFFNILIVSR
ncbi:MAG TPA: hypothetical protein VLM19_03115, partial [Nitrospiraceae bacterium]|nr:hypothetical protein [Nitrospiraceae bacterium]